VIRPRERLTAVECEVCHGTTTKAWSRTCRRCTAHDVDLEHAYRPTWAELIAAEPRLAGLEAQVRVARQMPGPKCANRVWYGRPGLPSMKTDYSRLVGWGRPRSAPGPEWLRSSEAYEVGYGYLYDLLPCTLGPDGCECSAW
jgi:hypothetical protein